MRARTLLFFLLAACSGQPSPSGLGEPLRVRGAVFHAAELPGFAAPADGAGAPTAGPRITSLDAVSAIASPSQAGHALSGRASADAYSVGVRVAGAGSGFWVLPVGGPDPSANNELTWNFTADFGATLPVGLQTLRLVAIDAQGRGGAFRDLRLCVAPEVPDGLNACDATLAPPALVITLGWDSDVDLDLVVRAPDGRQIDWRHPTSTAPDGGTARATLDDPTIGTLDRNANAACVIDGNRRENLVFRESPQPGTYRLYASLFSACGQSGARFRMRALTRESLPDGRFRQTERFARDGVVTSFDASGGATVGTFVGEVTLP